MQQRSYKTTLRYINLANQLHEAIESIESMSDGLRMDLPKATGEVNKKPDDQGSSGFE